MPVSKRFDTCRTYFARPSSNSIFATAVGLAITALMLSCSENPVGRRCFIDADAATSNTTIISSPSLQCPSRECLHIPIDTGKQLPDEAQYSDQCTATCDSDSDCDRVPESPCVGGFSCQVAVGVGPFCCQKKCICKDYITIPDGGPQPLPECDPAVSENTCCNLEGRETLPACQ